MQQNNTAPRKTLAERIFHALCFEIIATAICAPVSAWLMQRSVLEMGGISVLLATTAMLWNIVYNALFDRLWPANRVRRNVKVRVLHALGFEGGFIIVGVSVVSLTLGIGLVAAFLLEMGFFLFFLPYTVLYNWGYDTLRARVVARRRHAGELSRSRS